MINNQLTCLCCGLRFTGPPPKPFVKKFHDACKHTHLEEMGGSIFCTNCGAFEGYELCKDVCKHTHLDEKDGNVFCTDCGLFEEYELIDELCTDLEYHVKIQKDKNNLNEHSKVKELREAATKLGVKRVTVMSKKQLCEILGIKISNEGKYILKNTKTGEEHKFKTLQEISNKFNICLGLI